MNCDQEPKPEDFGLMPCSFCEIRKTEFPFCLCSGHGWLVGGRFSTEKEIMKRFRQLREARGQWD